MSQIKFDITPSVKNIDTGEKIISEVKKNEFAYQFKVLIDGFLFSTAWFYGTQESAQATCERLNKSFGDNVFIKKQGGNND